ncbi:MAG: hypothetical protein ACE5FE_05380 [Acidiferrobacterales bacterium]
MKKCFRIFSKVIVSLLIVFAFLEIGLRIFPSLIPIEFLIKFQEELRAEIAKRRHLPTRDDIVLLDRDDGGPPHRLRVYKPFTKFTYAFKDAGIAKTVVMDRTGFCNPPQHDYDIPTIDIIALGDSFTWCTSVNPEDTWTSKISSLTGRSIYNLGSPRLGVYEYLQILKRFGIQKSPRVVIMNIYGGNDLRDAVFYQSYRQATKDNGDVRLTSTPCATLSHYPCMISSLLKEGTMARYSYAFNLALAAGRRSFVYKRLKPNFRYRLVFPGNVIRFNIDNTDGSEIIQAKRLRAQETDLEIFTEALKTFVDLSRQNTFVPVVTYTPSAHTVYGANVVFEDAALSDLMPWFSRTQRSFFKAKGDELGYMFIDLTSSLQAAALSKGAQDLLYYPSNLHLTRRGHKVIAERISGALQGRTMTSHETLRPDGAGD